MPIRLSEFNVNTQRSPSNTMPSERIRNLATPISKLFQATGEMFAKEQAVLDKQAETEMLLERKQLYMEGEQQIRIDLANQYDRELAPKDYLKVYNERLRELFEDDILGTVYDKKSRDLVSNSLYPYVIKDRTQAKAHTLDMYAKNMLPKQAEKNEYARNRFVSDFDYLNKAEDFKTHDLSIQKNSMDNVIQLDAERSEAFFRQERNKLAYDVGKRAVNSADIQVFSQLLEPERFNELISSTVYRERYGRDAVVWLRNTFNREKVNRVSILAEDLTAPQKELLTQNGIDFMLIRRANETGKFKVDMENATARLKRTGKDETSDKIIYSIIEQAKMVGQSPVDMANTIGSLYSALSEGNAMQMLTKNNTIEQYQNLDIESAMTAFKKMIGTKDEFIGHLKKRHPELTDVLKYTNISEDIFFEKQYKTLMSNVHKRFNQFKGEYRHNAANSLYNNNDISRDNTDKYNNIHNASLSALFSDNKDEVYQATQNLNKQLQTVVNHNMTTSKTLGGGYVASKNKSNIPDEIVRHKLNVLKELEKNKDYVGMAKYVRQLNHIGTVQYTNRNGEAKTVTGEKFHNVLFERIAEMDENDNIDLPFMYAASLAINLDDNHGSAKMAELLKATLTRGETLETLKKQNINIKSFTDTIRNNGLVQSHLRLVSLASDNMGKALLNSLPDTLSFMAVEKYQKKYMQFDDMFDQKKFPERMAPIMNQVLKEYFLDFNYPIMSSYAALSINPRFYKPHVQKNIEEAVAATEGLELHNVGEYTIPEFTNFSFKVYGAYLAMQHDIFINDDTENYFKNMESMSKKLNMKMPHKSMSILSDGIWIPVGGGKVRLVSHDDKATPIYIKQYTSKDKKEFNLVPIEADVSEIMKNKNTASLFAHFKSNYNAPIPWISDNKVQDFMDKIELYKKHGVDIFNKGVDAEFDFYDENLKKNPLSGTGDEYGFMSDLFEYRVDDIKVPILPKKKKGNK
jgi:hypothetical protein